jgi:hypothetical protein
MFRNQHLTGFVALDTIPGHRKPLAVGNPNHPPSETLAGFLKSNPVAAQRSGGKTTSPSAYSGQIKQRPAGDQRQQRRIH